MSHSDWLSHALPVVEDPLPGAVDKSGPRMPKRVCCIVIGNHASFVGIIEMVHALHSYFSRHFTILVSQSLMPGAINVLIDEFSQPYLIEMMRNVRAADSATRFVILATEFVTRMAPLGLQLGNTFNYFDTADDYRTLLRNLGYRLGLRRTLPYFEARYRGFVAALPVADLLLCAHPAIVSTIALLPDAVRHAAPAPLTLYPEIDVARVATDPRLTLRPPGVVMTGTLTHFRRRIARELVKTFRRAQISGDFYLHRPFDPSNGIRFGERGVDLGYTRDSATVASTPGAYLYNLNPPQRPSWGYSSPMRLQRAILLGQIPLITHRFHDHPIEEVAQTWDGDVQTAEKLWVEASATRPMLIARHIAAVTRYDAVARERNTAIDAALAKIE